MKTYILFIFGMFDDYEDIEFFCENVLMDIKSIKSVKFIIENSQNIIVIFDSDKDYVSLSQDIFQHMVMLLLIVLYSGLFHNHILF